MPVTSFLMFITLTVFVREHAVNQEDAGTGSLLAALGEAGLLIGLERNMFANVHKNPSGYLLLG
ncbi:hypothetical protein Pint_18419 [Pistacia integerrima]|uniref:Uncharacterized protein n=1 Tax=Pistacia integerrima TaxID=434235 RepID=A0ACC0YYN5_9ROSI|nr:hypothetical protein Pint_18419 [Pistacia integerrima]